MKKRVIAMILLLLAGSIEHRARADDSYYHEDIGNYCDYGPYYGMGPCPSPYYIIHKSPYFYYNYNPHDYEGPNGMDGYYEWEPRYGYGWERYAP